MNVDGLLSWIELSDLVFEFTNSANSTLEYFLNEDSLLRMHILIITLFKFAVNVNVFDVEHCKILEDLILGPIHEYGLARFILLSWLVLILDLLLQLIHSILELQVVCTN